MQLSQLAVWSQGVLKGPDVEAGRVCIDSRQIQPGNVFLALKGEHFDGHNFLAQTAAQGAVAAVVEKPTDSYSSYILVKSSRKALGNIAQGWCDQFSLPRIAVTGNAGKTSVKEMIAVLLGKDALVTKGNLNNDIGVPLTLLRATERHRYGVFELGANHAGEIAWTVSLVQPQVVLITNVTGAHLEGFGSMQGIARAKAEIIEGAPEGATVIINCDDSFADYFIQKAEKSSHRIITVATTKEADWTAADWQESKAGGRFVLQHEGHEQEVFLPLPGKHQMINALQGIAAVDALGVDVIERLGSLATLQPVAGRMARHACGKGQLIDDSYNANPGSVKAAGAWLASQGGPQLFVLGGVAELGDESSVLHQQMGRDLAAAGLESLIVVGKLAKPAASGFGRGAIAVDKRESVLLPARNVLKKGGSVLVKGSRSSAMEAIVEALLNGNETIGEER